MEEEPADVLLSLHNLAAVLDLDLPAIAARKLDALEARYPVDLARGNALGADALAGISREGRRPAAVHDDLEV